MFQRRKVLYTFSFLILLVSLFAPSYTATHLEAKSTTSDASWEGQVKELNEKIAVLRRWQEGYRMTAEQAQFKADRLQFEENELIDAKRLWKVAENANQKAQDLQVIIDKLENQRNSILKRHHQPVPKN